MITEKELIKNDFKLFYKGNFDLSNIPIKTNNYMSELGYEKKLKYYNENICSLVVFVADGEVTDISIRVNYPKQNFNNSLIWDNKTDISFDIKLFDINSIDDLNRIYNNLGK